MSRLAVALLAITLTSWLVGSAAQAQDGSVTVFDKATGSSCEHRRSDCGQRFTGSTRYELRQLGAVLFAGYCNEELTVSWKGDGSGTVDGYLSDGAIRTSCTRIFCSGIGPAGEASTWRFSYAATSRENGALLRTSVCLDPVTYASDTPTRCDIDIDLKDIGSDAHRLASQDEICPLPGRTVWVTLDSRWTSDTPATIDIRP